MRVTLAGPVPEDFAGRLEEHGHEVRTVRSRPLFARRYARRGFDDRHGEWTCRPQLMRAQDDVAVAFHQVHACAALTSDRPVVFAPLVPIDRPYLVARRNRLERVGHAVRRSAAVVVQDDAGAAAMEHSLGVRPRVIPPDDAAGWDALLRELVASSR